jgi:hypothetical protein
MAVGNLRQLIVVLPDIDAVMVVTGSGFYPFSQLIDRVTAAATSPSPLRPDPVGSARLAGRIAEAAAEKPSPVAPASALARTISGKTYRFAPNTAHLKSLMLDLMSASPRYEITLDGPAAAHIEGPIGLDGRFRFRESQDIASLHGVKGSWLSENVFEIVSRSVLEGSITTYRMTFDDKRVDISLRQNNGFRLRLQGEAAE